MSNPSMKAAPSQNCKKNQEVISWEIVKDTDYQHFQLHSKLVGTLNLLVTAKVDEIKKYALLKLQGLGAENDMAFVEVPSNDTTGEASGAYRRSQMVTSVVIGEIAVSFDYPEQFTANNVDVDHAASCYRHFLEQDGVVNQMKPLQFSFRERLENWNIQCRMRPQGRIDAFYRYPRGKKSFRSVNEVVQFMLYETGSDTTYIQDVPQDQNNDEGEAVAVVAERPKKRRKSTFYMGRRKRKYRRRTKGNAEDEKADEEQAAATEEEEQEQEANEEKAVTEQQQQQQQQANEEKVVSEEQQQEESEADKDHNEDAENEQNTASSSPPEPQTQATPETDLLNISDDLGAYESLFDMYFDRS